MVVVMEQRKTKKYHAPEGLLSNTYDGSSGWTISSTVS